MKKALFCLLLLVLAATMVQAQGSGTTCTSHSNCAEGEFCIGNVCQHGTPITPVCVPTSQCPNLGCFDSKYSGAGAVSVTSPATTPPATAAPPIGVVRCASNSNCPTGKVCYQGDCMTIEDATRLARASRPPPSAPTSTTSRPPSTSTTSTGGTSTTSTSTGATSDILSVINTIISNILGGGSSSTGSTSTTSAGTSGATTPTAGTAAGTGTATTVTGGSCAIFGDEDGDGTNEAHEPYPVNTTSGCAFTAAGRRELVIVNDLASHTDGLGNIHPNWIVRLLYVPVGATNLQVLLGDIAGQDCDGGATNPSITPGSNQVYIVTSAGAALGAQYDIRPEIGWWDAPSAEFPCYHQHTDQMVTCNYTNVSKARSIRITHPANSRVTVRMSSFFPNFDYPSSSLGC